MFARRRSRWRRGQAGGRSVADSFGLFTKRIRQEMERRYVEAVGEGEVFIIWTGRLVT